MGATVDAIIENKLTPQSILSLQNKLNVVQPFNLTDENWRWQVKEINEDFLKEYWKRETFWLLNELKNKKHDKINQHAIIDGPGNDIQFISEYFTVIGSDIKWADFAISEEFRKKVLDEVSKIAEFLGADEIIFTNSFGSDTVFDPEEKGFTDLIKVEQILNESNIDFERVKISHK